jgi:PD-(D/E)XK nuclease superfamily
MSADTPLAAHSEDGPFTARQSTLRGLEQCGRRTWFDIEAGTDTVRGYAEASGDLGTVMHSVAEEILRTLWRQSETQMSTQESIEVMYEVYARSPIILPADELDDLVWLTLRFVEREWRVEKLLAVEERINVPIVCQDGVTRILSCQPDALFAGSTDTIIVADWKSGKGKPKQPRERQEGLPEDTAVGKQYLSERGHYQADSYSLAALHRYPAAERIVFRELHLRSGQIREAILGRTELEHVERQIGIHLMKLDYALRDGEQSKVWRPRPGSHCSRQCPVARSCPVPAEQRGVGAIEDHETADREAARYVVVDAVRSQLRDGLKTHFNETGYAARTGDGREVRWDGGAGGACAIVPVTEPEMRGEQCQS